VTKSDKDKKGSARELARELYVNKATESAHFRDANEQLNNHLASNPDDLAKQYPGTKDRAQLQAILGAGADKLDDRALYQKFLESVVGLDKGEIDEVESPTFKLLDAHYLEGCYLLREVSRRMPLAQLTKLQQAEFCFDWVMRQVLLQEGREELLPPQFVLRRGQGSAAERAFVFVSLLRQLDLDGCVIALPVKNGPARPWLVGVLIPNQDKQDVYLFDPRLGLPVPKGQGIATLADLKDPKLLQGFKVDGNAGPYDVLPEEIAKAQILLVCPLSGLSARMRYVEEDLLLGFDRINLAVPAADLFEKVQKLNAAPVRIWNSPAPKAGAYTQTPTSALRLFLPPEEGGIDQQKPLRYLKFAHELTPWPALALGYAEEKLSYADLPGREAQDKLQDLANRLWVNYILEPQQQLLRGRLDDCTKRLVRIQKALDEVKSENLNEALMEERIAKWRKDVQDAYVGQDAGKINQIWHEDQWLVQLANSPDEELANTKQMPRRLLSYIVLRALSEPLQRQSDFLLALRWQEKAERLKVQYDVAVANNANDADRARAKQEMKDAWNSARACWNRYGHENPLTAETVAGRLQVVKDQLKAGRHALAAGLLDYYVWLVRQAASARLLHARAMEQSQSREPAAAMLKNLATELAALEKMLDVDNLRGLLIEKTPREMRDGIRGIIAPTFADLGPHGSLFWLRYTAELRGAQLRRNHQ
jgi:hypothetical protein